MKLKTVKRMNACVLSAAMVLSGVTIIPPATVSAAANNEINYALSGTATVSDQETNYWGADKAMTESSTEMLQRQISRDGQRIRVQVRRQGR